jgi:hypothetical protein
LVTNEALLEAIFLKPLTDLIAGVHGKRVLRVLKPSQNREAFLGFDQGWVKIDQGIAYEDFEDELQRYIADPSQQQPMYYGYFLQYKVVKRMTRKSKHTPATLTPPYHRCELKTLVNAGKPLSQHQALRELSGATRTSVHYCVPEIFDADDVYDQPDLDKLRFFDVADSPEMNDNSHHFLCFEPGSDMAYWCSEPTETRPIKAEFFAQGLQEMLAAELLQLLRLVQSLDSRDFDTTELGPPRLPQALTILELDPTPNRNE